MWSHTEMFRRLTEFSKVPLAHLPTVFERLDRLSTILSPLEVYTKRDDQTGLAFGGNKTRKLEYIMGDIRDRGADSVVTWAGVQSNWCRQVAAATARVGIKSTLVLINKPGKAVENDGNLLLDRLFDADIRIVEASGEKSFLRLENVREFLDPVLEAEREGGRTPYLISVGGSLLEGDMKRPLGALGYVQAFAELMEQSETRGFTPDTVVLATGSSGTQAGLLAGAKLLSPGTRIVGISVAASAIQVTDSVKKLTEATLVELGAQPSVNDEDIIVLDDYLMDGYGVLNDDVASAVKLLAKEEGLLLDPVYTGKAMAALLDLAAKGFFKEGEKVVFLHTGGTPALFPYKDGLA